MRKREICWILALGLAVWAWCHYFGHFGEHPTMVVTASLRPPTVRAPRGQRRGGAGGNSTTARGGAGRGGAARGGDGGIDNPTNFLVLFEMLNPYKLTSIKVTEVETNQGKAPEHVLWHLVSTNGSDPVKTFYYGRNIQGMGPYLPGVSAEALVPHVEYRLELEAEKMKGSLKFQTIGLPE